MSFAVATRIARRELSGGLKGFRIFLACLALGVAAIAAVGSVRASIEAGLAREGAVLLGGDAMVELTYRRASDAERAVLEGISEAVSEVVDFRSMAQLPDGSDRALTQVKAVDSAWPLYGAAGLTPEMSLDEVFAGRDGQPGVAMDPLLIDRLELEVGDPVQLGDGTFLLMAALTEVPDNATAGFGFGPPTLARIDDMESAGLIREGTLFDAQYRLRLPPGADLDETRAQVEAALAESAPRWRDARNGTPQVRHAVERLGSFLVLVGLAGLAVGGVGISAAVRAYLDEKTETIATLKVLGADRRTIFAIYALQIGALALVGIAIGLVLGAGLPLAFAPLITGALPVPVEVGIASKPLAEAALYGLLAAALFTLWPLARTENVRAAALYRDAAAGAGQWPRPVFLALTLVLLAGLVAVAAWFSGIAKLTLWAAAGVFAAFLLLVLAGIAVRRVARWLAGRKALRGRPTLRMALASVGGPGNEAASVVLSLGLGLSVLAAVGQIDNNLRGAISRELPGVAPSFFVVDIQPDQIEALSERVTGDPGVREMERAPMLRGRITRINDRPAEEVAGDHWVVRGDRGVSYSAELPETTRLVAGEWWPEDYSGDPLISFSATEAEEIGLTLGDSMSLNILGREITGTVASFRDVDFSTGGMGFTVTLNPSALAGAPHSWIATIYADQAAEAGLMRDLSRTWPNITVISVRDAIAQVTGLMGQIAAAITYGALVTLATGAVVLIGAAAAGERARTYEAAVLKTLGAPRGRVLANFALRSAILGAAAGLVAVFAGGLAGWAVSRFVMETDFVFDPGSALVIVTGGIAVTLLAGLGFAWRPLSASPAQVLRARE
ncbi:ABC transporter permease [Maritimibacter sp. HL-12]|uniref:ABC transporter permease n=1 Tax=Maritimibacter sp. HL-12 TaxID=1162418 RepID=UPI000A0F3131|nr:FtsX-like permease family protein [Maritimibacter sp. HL-12]SMH40654.1 putative ABC transport system permease protein [Maritimibacter sp. HL-12]